MAKCKSDGFDSFNMVFTGPLEEPKKTPEAIIAEELKKREQEKEKKEITKRISVTVDPPVYEDIQKIASINQMSASSLIRELLKQHVENNQEVLQLYAKLHKKSKK